MDGSASEETHACSNFPPVDHGAAHGDDARQAAGNARTDTKGFFDHSILDIDVD